MKKKKARKDKVARDLRAWLDSDEGKEALAKASERAHEFSKRLEIALRPTYEQLHRKLYAPIF